MKVLSAVWSLFFHLSVGLGLGVLVAMLIEDVLRSQFELGKGDLVGGGAIVGLVGGAVVGWRRWQAAKRKDS